MPTLLQKVNDPVAEKLITAVSKLFGKFLTLEIDTFQFKVSFGPSPLIDPEEEMVAIIYFSLYGDASGTAILFLPKESAFLIADLMQKRELGSTQELEESDYDNLKEMGNIISGVYFNVFSRVTELLLIQSPPEYFIGTYQQCFDRFCTKLQKTEEKSFVIETLFICDPIPIKSYLWILLRGDAVEKILGEPGK